MIINLVRNAIQAMRSSARRELTIVIDCVDRTRVAVQVVDTGPGIAPEIADRLFQPFFTTKAEGMGIGLSICRTIIESHGGELIAEANPEGGTIFRFTLPGEEAADTALPVLSRTRSTVVVGFRSRAGAGVVSSTRQVGVHVHLPNRARRSDAFTGASLKLARKGYGEASPG